MKKGAASVVYLVLAFMVLLGLAEVAKGLVLSAVRALVLRRVAFMAVFVHSGT